MYKEERVTIYLFVSIILILLACIRYDYRTPQSEFHVPGLLGGIAVLVIIGIVLLFRIFNAVQDACIARGLMASRVQNWYDVLIPVAFFAVFFKGYWFGDQIVGMFGEEVYQWEFAWSDPDWDVPFLAALIVVVFLLRVQALFRAIEAHAKEAVAE